MSKTSSRTTALATATATSSARAIPWQLEGCTFYHMDIGSKRCRDWTPVEAPDPERFNLGLPLGMNCFVDIETDGDTEAERQAAAEWVENLGLPSTFTWASRLGLHRIFRVPAGSDLHKSKPFPKVEFLCGRNYALVPPSEAGGVVRVVTNDVDVAQLPDSVLDLFRAPYKSSGKASGSGSTTTSAADSSDVIPVGERSDTLLKIERRNNWSRDWWSNVNPANMPYADALYNEPCEEPMEGNEIESTMRSAAKDEYRAPACKRNPTVFVGEHYPDLTTNEHLFMVDFYSYGLIWVDGKHIEVERAMSQIAKENGFSERTGWRVWKSLVDKGYFRKMKDDEPSVRERRYNDYMQEATNRYLVPIPDIENDPAFLFNKFVQQQESAKQNSGEQKDQAAPSNTQLVTYVCHSALRAGSEPYLIPRSKAPSSTSCDYYLKRARERLRVGAST